jgi:hypothetical protein
MLTPLALPSLSDADLPRRCGREEAALGVGLRLRGGRLVRHHLRLHQVHKLTSGGLVGQAWLEHVRHIPVLQSNIE